MAQNRKKEEQFTQCLLERIDRAEQECSCRQVGLRQEVTRLGGVATARGLVARGRVSQGFDHLAQKGRLELSLEKTAIEGTFAELFTDEEADWFLTQLLEVGYY